ncbi:hypothetical protein AGMMS50222_10310 [Endomicrobiia bacterium]|nr:hypothetical protein AGMMS49556_09550 [Endomicrobiia bacterium]GHT76995.1 hypothetical protein AGMMS50222_10310 [Endomicrobiia bacterium]
MKDFKQAAAAQFISLTHNDKQEVEKHREELMIEKNQEVEKHREELMIEKKAIVETKTKHLSLLIKPSTYAALKAQSKNKDLSINEIANQVLEYYANR